MPKILVLYYSMYGHVETMAAAIAEGRLTVPVAHVWNHGDQNSCGSVPIDCPMRDGTTTVLGATDCNHEPLRQAIAALGPGARSINLPLCIQVKLVADAVINVRLHF